MILLGLGSNIGDRTQHLRRAVTALSGILSGIACSRVYETPALLPPDAPRDWDIPYYNMVLSGSADISPQVLLSAAKAIEKYHGRQHRGFWAPREIDVDILAMGGRCLQEEDLIIPHKSMAERDFVMVPLAELAPDWRFPAGQYEGQTAASLCAAKGYKLPLAGQQL